MSTPLSVAANFTVSPLTLSPTSLNFGNVLVDHPKKEIVTLKNTSSKIIYMGPITLTVTQGDGSQFRIDHVCEAKLRPGTSCLIGVIFTPDAVGPDTATLNIGNSLGSPIEVPITAAGVEK